MVQLKFLTQRKERQNKGKVIHKSIAIIYIGKRSLFLTVIESIGVIGLTIWQIYYIKKLLDTRHSV